MQLEPPYGHAGLPIHRLAQAFDNVTNAYKFYWFKAILQAVAQDQPYISMKHLALQMLSDVWYPLDYFKLSFGKHDGFKPIAQRLSAKITIDSAHNAPSLLVQLSSKLTENEVSLFQKEIKTLVDYVPYRFQSPFFSEQLRGLNENQKNSLIEKLANEAFLQGKTTCMYRYVGDDIEIQRDWMDYMKAHLPVLQGFINWHLLKFMQKHNLHVVGLSSKLKRPQRSDRDLSKERKYWELYINAQSTTHCIYSGMLLQEQKIAVDHFVPWSYVVHNEIWNLVPTLPTINAAKSDWLPSATQYLQKFSLLQYQAFRWNYREHHQLRNDHLYAYAQIFGQQLAEVADMEPTIFQEELQKVIQPLLQSAQLLGFPIWWVYRG